MIGYLAQLYPACPGFTATLHQTE